MKLNTSTIAQAATWITALANVSVNGTSLKSLALSGVIGIVSMLLHRSAGKRDPHTGNLILPPLQ